MVKKCLGSILLPEKHSLLYLSMLLRQELFTLNKNRRNGGGRKISNSPVYWRLAGWNSTQGGSRQELKRPNPWKPQTSLCRGTTETALLQPLDSKGKPVNIKSFFIRFPQSLTDSLYFPQNTVTTHSRVHPVQRCEGKTSHSAFSFRVTRNSTTRCKQNFKPSHLSDAALNQNRTK